MRKQHIYFGVVACLFTALCCSCSSDEDLTASGANDNYFKVAVDDMSEDAALRRQFYEKNGIYLLFNDTLRHEYVGKDVAGEDAYFNELVDFNYNLTDVGSSEFDFSYLSSMADKRAAVDFVEKYVLPHFGGGGLVPYSFFLADKLMEYGYANSSAWQKTWNDRACISCFRCMGLALGKVPSMTEDEKRAYASEICIAILQSKLTYTDERLDDFYAPADDLFYEYLEDVIPDWSDDDWDGDMSVAYEYGFLKIDGRWYLWFPSMANDFAYYFDLVMTKSEDEVKATYGDYPLVMQRYYKLREVVEAIGYKF